MDVGRYNYYSFNATGGDGLASGLVSFTVSPPNDELLNLDAVLQFEVPFRVPQSNTGIVQLVPFAGSLFINSQTIELSGGPSFASGGNSSVQAPIITRAFAENGSVLQALYGNEPVLASGTVNADALTLAIPDSEPNQALHRTYTRITSSGEVILNLYHPMALGVSKIGHIGGGRVVYTFSFTTPSMTALQATGTAIPATFTEDATTFTAVGNPRNFRLKLIGLKPLALPSYLNPANSSQTTIKHYFPKFNTQSDQYVFQAGSNYSFNFTSAGDVVFGAFSQIWATKPTTQSNRGLSFGGPALAQIQLQHAGANFPLNPLENRELPLRYAMAHYTSAFAGKNTGESFSAWATRPFDAFRILPPVGTSTSTIQVTIIVSTLDYQKSIVTASDQIRVFMTMGSIEQLSITYQNSIPIRYDYI